MKECKHERAVAYTEDGARYHACLDCPEIFPQLGPTNEPPPVRQPTPQTGESTGVEGESSDWSYSGHYFDHVEGHLNNHQSQPFTVTLTPNASCTQAELNAFGERLAQLLRGADRA